jgi:uncharacterized lipoprotein YddW (UPF0748 family)
MNFLQGSDLSSALKTTVEERPGELRGLWVDSWNPGLLSAEQIDNLIEIAYSAHINALFVEVRKAGDAYYQSKTEPLAESITPGFDPLQEIITKAHQRGIEVHAWLVTYRAWKGETTPQSESHVFNSHPEWLTQNFTGSQEHEEGYYLDPGVPEVQEYLAQVFLEVMQNYAVDGIHFDYVRYPGKDWGYNPVSVARFQQEFNRTDKPEPSDPDWCDWRRQQVTNLIRRVYVDAMAVNWKLKVTAATITWGAYPKHYQQTSAYSQVMQDWDTWMQQGVLDVNIPMNYKRELDLEQAKDFRAWCTAAAKRSYERHVYMGLGAFINPAAKTLAQIRKAISLGSQGTVLFSYFETNNEEQPKEQFFQVLKQKLFKESVPVPAMPWKTTPVTGIIRGTVRDKTTQKPLSRARVWLAGTSQTTLTDALGFYAFPKVPTGIYNITVSKTGYTAVTQQGTAVVAGSVTTLDQNL